MNTQLIKRAGFLFLTAILVLFLTAWKPPPVKQAPAPEKPAGIALAVTITVTTTTDAIAADDNCSLREAIRAANLNTTVNECPAGSSSETDTITLANGSHYDLTIAGKDENEALTGDLDIVDDSPETDLIINVASGGTATIDASGITDRVLQVLSGAGVQISGVTISGGNGVDTGGGIYNGGTLTLDASTVSANTATSNGGGIYNDVGGNMTVDASTVSANTATRGGGIFNGGTLTLDASTISANTASIDGAGLYNSPGATMTIQNGTVIGGPGAGNMAIGGASAGGIFNYNGTLTIDSSTISHNTSANSAGGIMIHGGNASITNSTITENTATMYGGGIIISAFAGHTSVLNTVISNNSAAINGGGIYSGGSLTVDSSTVSGNAATNYGGGIWNNGTLTIQNDTTIGKAGAGNTAGTGGGVYNNGTLTVNASTISSNEANADHGGGIYTDTSGTTTVNASLVILNHTWSGGGFFNKGILTVQNGSIIGGTGMGNSVPYDGGGIYNDDGGTTTVDASTVSHNTALYGGGIFNGGILVVQNASLVSANTAYFVGGGIQNGGGYNNYYGNTTVDTSTISANSAYKGGGILSQGTLTILNSLIAGNTASYGGGIFNAVGATTVTASTFSGNSAADTGGGTRNEGTLTVTNSTFSGNSASQGGGIWNNGTLTIQNGSTIGGAGAGNSAGHNGGGIYTGGTLTLDASTVSANSADYGGGIYNDVAGSMTVDASKLLTNTATNDGDAVFNDKNSTNAVSVTGSCIVNNENVAFFNNQSALQTATGNWWGNDAGPGPVGTGVGDTVSANVDTSGYLTAPILGCPSVTRSALAASKVFAKTTIPLNTTTRLSITLTNPNVIPINWISFTDALPSGLTASAATTSQCGGVVNISTPSQIVFSGGSLAANDGSPDGPDTCAINVTVRGIAPGIQTNASFVIERTGLPDGHSNPTSITVYKTLQFRSSGTVDGWVLESDEFSNKGGSFNATSTTFHLGDDASNKQYRSILSFYTSGLPDDAVILSAVLKIKKQGLVGSNPFSTHQGLLVDIKKPYFGTALALAAHDFQAVANKLAVGTFGTVPSSGWYSVTLLNTAYPYINRTGTTQLRLRFKMDDDNNNVADYMKFFSGNYGTTTDRPVLVIQYYIP